MEIGQSMYVASPIIYQNQFLGQGLYRFDGMTANGLEMMFETDKISECTLSEKAYYEHIKYKHIIPPDPRATAAVFFALCASGKSAITKPQAQILRWLREGYKIWIINQHHASGGQWAWKRPAQSNPQYAGKVYKAFWGLMHNVLYKNGFDDTPPADFFHEEDWRGQI